VPILKTGGEVLTKAFYERMFTHDPEVRYLFNKAHQFSGDQPKALANSVLAYASNIEDLTPLSAAVEMIAQKHVSLDIWPEHYPIVGRNLLNAMVEVLGKETATPAIVNAWAEAYGALAKILIEREAELYRQMREQPGGWNGKRAFVVKEKIVKESGKLCSLVLEPLDGGIVPHQKEGQYLTIHPPPALYAMHKDPVAARNYSISSAPNGKSYRITIGRAAGDVAGVFSSYLIDKIKVGDQLPLGPPCGEFYLDHSNLSKRPQVFIAGGVGLTPLVPMIESAAAKPNKGLHWYYAGVDSSSHPLIEGEIAQLAQAGKVKRTIAYEAPKGGDKADVVGRLNPADIVAKVGKDIDVYVCGSAPFMHAMLDGFKAAGVESCRYELFGPMLSF